MRKMIATLACVIASALAFSSASAATPSMKAQHKNLDCVACHGEKAPTAPTKTQCTSCHGSGEDMAKKSATKYKQYYNPHDSLHYASYADCVLCHREHTPSRLDCNNSKCHSEFKYAVP